VIILRSGLALRSAGLLTLTPALVVAGATSHAAGLARVAALIILLAVILLALLSLALLPTLLAGLLATVLMIAVPPVVVGHWSFLSCLHAFGR